MKTHDSTGQPASVSDIVGGAQAARFVVQNYCPPAQSLEWELGQSYLDRGSRAFSGDQHIPYAINNDGNASVEAAELLLNSLIASDETGSLSDEIRVLEIGPGLGLFARLFLDAFRSNAAERGKDYYDRLTYVVGDRSPQMLTDICRRGVFGNHPGRYQLRVMDAISPDDYLRSGADSPQNTPFRAVFLN